MININPYRMYKFGKTNSEDVLERYDPEVHKSRRWRKIPLGRDYDIKVLWSMWIVKDRATKAEAWLRDTYPKQFYCLTPYNGITECRTWTVEESYFFTSLLNKHYPKTPKYWEEVSKLKQEGTLQTTHDKIYFIMLTKKQ